MTDIQPLTAEELAEAREDLMGFAIKDGNAVRVSERLLATIDAKDAEIKLLKQVIEAVDDLPYLPSCFRCESEFDMPELDDAHEAVRKYREYKVNV